MKISLVAQEMIKKFEGCILTAYKDTAGVLTIGYGHTKGVVPGQVISIAQAEAYFKADVEVAESKVDKYKKYGFNDNQYEALVSFAFNIGSIDQLTDNGTRGLDTIRNKITAYCKATDPKTGLKVAVPGLLKRREAELKLFDTPINSITITPERVQLNYQVGKTYVTTVSLNVRTKSPKSDVSAVPAGKVIDTLKPGTPISNKATGRVGNSIWMYIGNDNQGRERWVCADIGITEANKSYVK